MRPRVCGVVTCQNADASACVWSKTYENQIAEEEIEEESDNENLDEEEEDDDDDDDDDDNDIESAMNAILGANSARSGAGASSASFKNFYLSSFSSNSNQALPKFELLINDPYLHIRNFFHKFFHKI